MAAAARVLGSAGPRRHEDLGEKGRLARRHEDSRGCVQMKSRVLAALRVQMSDCLMNLMEQLEITANLVRVLLTASTHGFLRRDP
jgi:hypothetical protein